MITKPKGTYEQPKDGWVCFHCGIRITDVRHATEHFGDRPYKPAACQISRQDLQDYRRLESRLGMLTARARALYRSYLPTSPALFKPGAAAIRSWGLNRNKVLRVVVDRGTGKVIQT